MMKEIGGYFELEKLVSNEYHKGLFSLNSGRNALLYILRAKNINKLYIPYFLCNSIKDMLKLHRYRFEFYHIDSNFMPAFNKILGRDEYLYVVNYYGQLNNQIAEQLKQKYKQIILDNTHAFFQKPIEGIDTIYTARKFFGVPDGAYLYTDTKLEDDLALDVSKDKMAHLLGRYENEASEYYGTFKNNENSFINASLKLMSEMTHNILGAIDYEEVIRKRNANYVYLHDKLNVYNKLNLEFPNGAFTYPFYMENGLEIKLRLAEKKIYVPTLWPNVIRDNLKNSIEHSYAANILPLPCDQRYGGDEMEYIVKELMAIV